VPFTEPRPEVRVRTKLPLQADRMLDAASRLFAARHFHEVRMEDIASEAGVGKGTLYRYFHTKDDLYLKLLERAAEQYLARLRQAVGATAGARDRLVAVAAAIVAYFDEQPHVLELIQRAEVERGRGEGFPWQQAREELFRMVTGLFAEGTARGEFTVADPNLSMMLLLGGLRTVIRFGPRPRPPDAAERAVDALLHHSPGVRGQEPGVRRQESGIRNQ
jgi:AcrR family transcriptional regulator